MILHSARVGLLEPQTFALIAFFTDRSPPPAVQPIPVYGALDAGLQSVGGLPAELSSDVADVQTIATIVTRSIGNKGDEISIGRA